MNCPNCNADLKYGLDYSGMPKCDCCGRKGHGYLFFYDIQKSFCDQCARMRNAAGLEMANRVKATEALRYLNQKNAGTSDEIRVKEEKNG